MNERSIPAIALPSWAKAAARCGFNIEPIFAAEGIELNLSRLEQSSVPIRKLDRVLETCIARTGEGHFPFYVGETFAFEYLPDLETFLNTSSCLRDAARILDWIPALINPHIDAVLEESAHSAHLVLRLAPAVHAPGKPYHAEMFFASIVKFVRVLIGGQQDMQELRFRHSPPPHAAEYEAYFRLPVRFDCDQNELLMTRASLDRPLHRAYPALHEQAAALVERRVASLERQPLSETIERLLLRDIGLLPAGLPAVANALNLGERTLQRRLRDEGESFKTILERAQSRHARQLLSGGKRVDAVSDALGFSDRRAFTRAFKRWTGQTPRDFARQ